MLAAHVPDSIIDYTYAQHNTKKKKVWTSARDAFFQCRTEKVRRDVANIAHANIHNDAVKIPR